MATHSVERLGRMWRTQKNLRVIARNSRRSWPSAAPVWPLPRQAGGPSDEEIRADFAKYPLWHYVYRFQGGLDFAVRHVFQDPLADSPERPLQRFRHFMPWLLQATGGKLEGKRVLDVACNSGFWSIQCALLGAKEVVGFDARQELIDQANLIKRIVGVRNVDYRLLNLWEMTPDALGGTFDVVLTLGILYHLPKPVEALERTKAIVAGSRPARHVGVRRESAADLPQVGRAVRHPEPGRRRSLDGAEQAQRGDDPEAPEVQGVDGDPAPDH